MIILVEDGTPLGKLRAKVPFIKGACLGMALAPFGVFGHGNAETNRLMLLPMVRWPIHQFCRKILRFILKLVVQASFVTHLGYHQVMATSVRCYQVGLGGRKRLTRLGVDSVLVLGDANVVFRPRRRVGGTVECVLERLRCRPHFEDVEASGLRRVQGQSRCVDDARCPSLWRSPYHIACPYPCRHLVFLQLCTSRSLLGVLSLSLFVPISSSAESADLCTMAGKGSHDLDLIPRTFHQVRFDGLHFFECFAWLPHTWLRQWKHFMAVTTVAVELPAHCVCYLREGDGVPVLGLKGERRRVTNVWDVCLPKGNFCVLRNFWSI